MSIAIKSYFIRSINDIRKPINAPIFKSICLIISICVITNISNLANASILQSKDTIKQNRNRLITVLATETGLSMTSLVLLNNLWYKDYPRDGFHIFNDNNEWLLMDKMGHTTSSYRISGMSYSLLKWSGIQENKAIWIGGTTGLVYLTAIEILDGYSTEWGYSPGDEIADFAGSTIFIGQQLLWHEQRLKLKWSFHQTHYSDYRPDLLGKNLEENILKDYNGQTYWLSANVSSFLTKDVMFPKWLNFAIGYGADGMLGARTNPETYKGNILPVYKRRRQFYFSADIDLSRIKTNSLFLKTMLNVLGILKIPMPTLEYNTTNKKLKGYYIYF